MGKLQKALLSLEAIVLCLSPACALIKKESPKSSYKITMEDLKEMRNTARKEWKLVFHKDPPFTCLESKQYPFTLLEDDQKQLKGILDSCTPGKDSDLTRYELRVWVNYNQESGGVEATDYANSLLGYIIKYNQENDYFKKEKYFILGSLDYRYCLDEPPVHFPFGMENCKQSSVEIYLQKTECKIKQDKEDCKIKQIN